MTLPLDDDPLLARRIALVRRYPGLRHAVRPEQLTLLITCYVPPAEQSYVLETWRYGELPSDRRAASAPPQAAAEPRADWPGSEGGASEEESGDDGWAR
jgi:hypothetical protein